VVSAHGWPCSCAYCRALVIADDGPDDWEPYHYDPYGSEDR
jgi:hypothetical protein